LSELESRLDEIVLKHFGKNYKFRKYQKEVILNICETFLDRKVESYILELPTGGGKSHIAMAVSRLLNTYNNRGYILASDLSLQAQYETDLLRFQFDFGNIKGIDNYICPENGEKHSLGECTICGIPYNQRQSLPCYRNCPYYQARDKAIKTDTSLLNYSYGLICRNYVDQNCEAGEMWGQRDFVICDEAHKVIEIVQNHFSPRIDITTNSKLERLREFFIEHDFGDIREVSKTQLASTIDRLFTETNPKILQETLCDFEFQLEAAKDKAELMKLWISKRYSFRGKQMPRDIFYAMSLLDYCKDIHCKVEDYNAIIAGTGVKSLIKNPAEESITFNCLDESYLMTRYFHEKFGFSVFMSATIGDPKQFAITNKLESAKGLRLPSNFDFGKSPIICLTGRKMSYSEKEQNFPFMISKVEEIMDYHRDEKGIIHTGSYSFGSQLFNGLSSKHKKRILFYNTSEQKREILEQFYKSKDKILIGPSILEGVDFYDDRSRFQVYLKVPYPSLADKFIAAKLQESQSYYNRKTILSFVQGVGRSVRNETDFCSTYVLDGCFQALYFGNQNEFADDFKKRVIWKSFDEKL